MIVDLLWAFKAQIGSVQCVSILSSLPTHNNACSMYRILFCTPHSIITYACYTFPLYSSGILCKFLFMSLLMQLRNGMRCNYKAFCCDGINEVLCAWCVWKTQFVLLWFCIKPSTVCEEKWSLYFWDYYQLEYAVIKL